MTGDSVTVKLPDPKTLRRYTLDTLGVIGAVAGIWCLIVHADLVGGAAAAIGGSARFAWVLLARA